MGEKLRAKSAGVKQGFRSFLRRHLVGIKRLQYAIIIITCSAVLITQIVECVNKYLAKNTATADKYVHVSKTAFPVLTICPTYPYKLDVLQASIVLTFKCSNFNVSFHFQQNGIQFKNEIQFQAKWISDNPSLSPQDFYRQIVLNVEDVVDKVTIYVEQLLDGKNILKLKPHDEVCNGEKLFTIKEYYFNGDCFPLVVSDCIRQAGVLEIVFEFKNKTDIFIHHQGQFLSPNSRLVL